MKTRIFLSCAAFAFTACGEGGAAAPRDEEQLPQEAVQALHVGADDAGARCRARVYPIFKDKRSPQVPRDDVELIDTLVPHHRSAIEMAQMELEHGADQEVKAMAAKMKDDQSAEIAQLLRIREELTGCQAVKPFPDPHMERDMAMMTSMHGAELDMMFVEHMIPHHAGAIVFTHNALRQLAHPELDDLAHQIIDVQSMEIGDLHRIKMRLEQQPSSDGGAVVTP